MVLQIVHYGDPVLRKKGEPVTVFDASLAKLAEDMIETMGAAEGIGLAAQQIGKALQFCVVDLRGSEAKYEYELDGVRPPVELFMPMTIANPQIEPVPEPTTVYEEGCLSFPGIHGDVVRPDAIRVRFQDVKGARHELVCNGLLSRCIQHEADHLNGVLFIDRMTKRVFNAIDPEVKRLKKQTRKAMNV